MKISLITATLNRAATLGEALESLDAQTHTDWEHIVQDGLSTDDTADLLANRTDSRRHSLSEADSGIYDALNRANARATGDIVGVLHSDDTLAGPQVLARIAAAFDATDIAAVYGDLNYVATHDPARVVRHWKSGIFERSKLKRGWMPPHPALFVRRDVLAAAGPYDTNFTISADYDLILRLFARPGFRATYVPHVLVRMRLGGASNGSAARVLRKSREDLQALRKNGIGGAGTLALKNLRKFPQLIPIGRSSR